MPARLASFLPPALLSAVGLAATPLVPPVTSVVQESTVADNGPAVLVSVAVHYATPLTYTVRPGDTLSAIAGRACGNPGDDLALAYNNGVANPDLIYAGQVFKIACQAAAAAIAGRYGLPGSSPVSSASHGDEDGDSDAAGAAPVYHRSSGARVSPAAGTYHGSTAMQQCIIARESGGNPNIWNATGHWGLYQFSAATWAAHGGNPADFGRAGIAEQNRVFYNTVAADGYSDWAPYDGC